MPTKEKRNRLHGGHLVAGVAPLDGAAFQVAPQPVQEASIEFAQALDRMRVAHHEAREARKVAEGAEGRDRVVAREAVRNGESIPPREAPEAVACAVEAQRRAGAAEELAVEAQRGYLAAVVTNVDEFRAAAASARERAAMRLLMALGEIEAGLLDAVALDRLLHALAEPGYLHGRGASFDPRPPTRLTGDVAKALARLRTTLGGET